MGVELDSSTTIESIVSLLQVPSAACWESPQQQRFSQQIQQLTEQCPALPAYYFRLQCGSEVRAGKLPASAKLHELGVCDGDTLYVVPTDHCFPRATPLVRCRAESADEYESDESEDTDSAPLNPKPDFDAAMSLELVAQEWGLQGYDSTKPLPSYDDQNLMICSSTGAPRLVLKIAASGAECRDHADEASTYSQLEMENAGMVALGEAGLSVPVPLVAKRSGSRIVRVMHPNGGDSVNFVRLITFLDGELLAKVDHEPQMLMRLGSCIGTSDNATADFQHPGAVRTLTWDLANAGMASKYLNEIKDAKDRQLAKTTFNQFGQLGSRARRLRKQVVHGDMNDYNILVTRKAYATHSPGDVQGIGTLDFGDMVHTSRVYNLAVALAYICQNKGSGLEALQTAITVVRGYCQSSALDCEECACLFVAVKARLAQSVSMSAHSIKEDPSNEEYLAVNAVPGWRLLHQWDGWSLQVAADAFRIAAGHASAHCSSPSEQRLVQCVVQMAALDASVQQDIQQCNCDDEETIAEFCSGSC